MLSAAISMPLRLHGSGFYKSILILVGSALMIACASEQPLVSDQPVEPSFQEKVSECARIADRSERDRCLYGG